METNARSANEVWLELLCKVVSQGEKVSPRGQPGLEILCNREVVDMNFPVVSVGERKLGKAFMAAEAWWILTGRNDVESIEPYSAKIASFANEEGRFDGAYGPMIVDQLKYVVDSLCSDRDTRQAVLTIWRRNPRPSKDIPCTVACQWFIRENKLHCIDTMRSSDVWLGWPYDCLNFSMLSAWVLLAVHSRLQINSKDLSLGKLYITAGSQHAYERDLNKIERIFNNPAWQEYEPFDADRFESPGQLVQHLADLKDFQAKPNTFLGELYR